MRDKRCLSLSCRLEKKYGKFRQAELLKGTPLTTDIKQASTLAFLDQVCYFCISYLSLGILTQIPENRTVAFSLPQPM